MIGGRLFKHVEAQLDRLNAFEDLDSHGPYRPLASVLGLVDIDVTSFAQGFTNQALDPLRVPRRIRPNKVGVTGEQLPWPHTLTRFSMSFSTSKVDERKDHLHASRFRPHFGKTRKRVGRTETLAL